MIMNTNPDDPARTGPQSRRAYVSSTQGAHGNLLQRSVWNTNKWYRKVREMRRDPTIALVRTLFAAPIMVANWSFESTDDAPEGAAEFVEQQVRPWRRMLLQHSIRGALFDFGWQPFETVMDPTTGGITKIKPLLQDITDILVYTDTGGYAGLRQGEQELHPTNTWIDLDIDETLTISFDVEGTNWYGNPIMPNAEIPYNGSIKVNQASDVYVRKVAGSHWVIHYPIGRSMFNGTELDNGIIATRLLQSLENSGSIIIPHEESMTIERLGWKVELLSDQGATHDTLLDRSRYMDVLKVRAFGVPERSVLEGEFGTKAESESQQSFALTQLEQRHEDIVQPINWHLVNRILRLAYGDAAQDTVYIQPQAVHDEALGLLRELYIKILDDPGQLLAEVEQLDMQAMRARLELPENLEEDDDDRTRPRPTPRPEPMPSMNDILSDLISI